MFRIQSKLNSPGVHPARWSGKVIRLFGLLALAHILVNCGGGNKGGDSESESFLALGGDFDGNNLGNETSALLQSMADSKIRWQAFSPEVVDEAKRVNRPLFLVVSTHEGMAQSRSELLFEDEDFAALVNGSFIPVMVDADERPDLGAYYLEFSVLLRRVTMWPLMLVTTPDGLPIEVVPHEINSRGTYSQIMSWMRGFANRWRSNPELLKGKGTRLLGVLSDLLGKVVELEETDAIPTQSELVSKLYSGLSSVADDEFGVFTKGRSFIRPTIISSLTCLTALFEDGDYRKERIKTLTEKSLDIMQKSAIYDHVFGGWYRDSDPPTWNSPRGGKYLVDQAEMAIAYLDGYRAFGNSDYLETARMTGDFVLEFLQKDNGQFRHGVFSRSDFGLKSPVFWRPEEIKSVLDAEQYEVVKTLSKLSRYGNIPSLRDETGSRANVLAILEEPSVASSLLNLDENKMFRIWNGAMDELKDNEQRLSLWRADDHVTLGESSRAIYSLVYLWKVTGDGKYLDGAVKGLDFLKENVLIGEVSEWPRLWNQGPSDIKAYPADLFALSLAVLRVFEATGDVQLLELSIGVADHVFSQQGDLVSDNRAQLISRFKMWDTEWRSTDDQTTATANGLALELSSDLAVITGKEKWLNIYDALALAMRRISNDWLLFASGSSIKEVIEDPRNTKVFVVPRDESRTWRIEYSKVWKETFPQELILLRGYETGTLGDEQSSNLSSTLVKAAQEPNPSIIQPLK